MRTVEHVTTTTAEWLLEISGLTIGTTDGADAVSRGHHLAAQVRSAAAAFCAATSCGPDGCAAACPLASYDGGFAACHLASELAPDTPRNTTMDAHRAAMLYVQALRAASTAVFHCRRQAHPTGECWFSTDGTARCGDVLAVTHRLGG